eukprot:scaffold1117_cov167-Amphora_coffeaeformis.AAC.5
MFFLSYGSRRVKMTDEEAEAAGGGYALPDFAAIDASGYDVNEKSNPLEGDEDTAQLSQDGADLYTCIYNLKERAIFVVMWRVCELLVYSMVYGKCGIHTNAFQLSRDHDLNCTLWSIIMATKPRREHLQDIGYGSVVRTTTRLSFTFFSSRKNR